MANTFQKLGAIAAASLAFGAAACSRVPDNEVAVKLSHGSVHSTVTEAGIVCFLPCLVGTEFVRYGSVPDTFTISSGQGASAGGNEGGQTTQARQIFLRSKDDKFIESVSISVIYEVANNENISLLYREFQASAHSAEANRALIRDDLQILATQPLVNIIREYNALDIQDQGGEIGTRVAAALQQAVNERLRITGEQQSPIRIVGVTLGGVRFDAETEALLRQTVYATEQAALSRIAAANAGTQAEGAAAQARVTGEIVRELRNAGAPENQVASLTCLDLVRTQRLVPTTQCFGIGGISR